MVRHSMAASKAVTHGHPSLVVGLKVKPGNTLQARHDCLHTRLVCAVVQGQRLAMPVYAHHLRIGFYINQRAQHFESLTHEALVIPVRHLGCA